MKTLLQGMQDGMYFEMKSFLESRMAHNESQAVRQIKLLYDSCINETNSGDSNRALSSLIGLFATIGGQWPLLRVKQSVTHQDLEYRLSSLMLYQVKPFFQVYIEPEQSNKSGNYAIHVRDCQRVITVGSLLCCPALAVRRLHLLGVQLSSKFG